MPPREGKIAAGAIRSIRVVFQIYKVKDKKHKEDEIHSSKKNDKELLLWLVKIFHADPVFAFHVIDQ